MNKISKITFNSLMFACLFNHSTSGQYHLSFIPTDLVLLTENTSNQQPETSQQTLPLHLNQAYGLKIGAHTPTHYTHISPIDFKELSQTAPDDCALLCHLEYFNNKEFIRYARTLPIYKEFMRELQIKVHKNKHFTVPGFKISHCFGTVKSQFKDLVDAEVKKIEKEEAAAAQKNLLEQETARINRLQNMPRLSVANPHEITSLRESCATRLATESSEHTKKIVTARMLAIEKTTRSHAACFDYAASVPALVNNDAYASVFENTYGTQLDQQLHKELYQSRLAMIDLEQKFPQNAHVRLIAPNIHHLAAQAKINTNITTAFTLADFCHDITQTLSTGMGLLSSATKNVVMFVNNDLGPRTLLAKAIMLGVGDSLDKTSDLGAKTINMIVNDPQKLAEKVVEHAVNLALFVGYVTNITNAPNIANNIKTATANFIKKVAQMSPEECARSSACFVTDLATLTALPGAVSKGIGIATGVADAGAIATTLSRAVTQDVMTVAHELSQNMNQWVTSLVNRISPEAVEVAGIGKVVIEDSAEAAVKNDLCVLAKKVEDPLTKTSAGITYSSEWMENIAYKIRNVGDDILDIMENAGGHALKEHVGLTSDELVLRAARVKINAASSFPNKRTAINAVKENLRHNAQEIIQWLKNYTNDQKLSLNHSHNFPIGSGVPLGKKIPIHGLKNSRVVLKKDATMELGFKIITAFPITS